MSTASPVVIAARHAAHFKWTTTCASARALRLPENQKRKIKNKPKKLQSFWNLWWKNEHCRFFEHFNYTARESSPRESPCIFSAPAPPARTGSQTGQRPETTDRIQAKIFRQFWLHFIFGLFIYIFYFWGICRVINKFATLPQDICIRNYGNEMLWSQANDRRRRCAAVTGTATETGSGCGSGSAGTNGVAPCNKVTAAFRRLWSERALPLKSPTTTGQHNMALHKQRPRSLGRTRSCLPAVASVTFMHIIFRLFPRQLRINEPWAKTSRVCS